MGTIITKITNFLHDKICKLITKHKYSHKYKLFAFLKDEYELEYCMWCKKYHVFSDECGIYGCCGFPKPHKTADCPNNCSIKKCVGGHTTEMHEHIVYDIRDLFK